MTKDSGGLFDLFKLDIDAPNGDGLTLSATGYTSLTFVSSGNGLVDFLGVSEVVFANFNSYGLGIDNVVVDAAQVPEPASLGLFGLGVVGLIRARRRKIC